MTLVVSCIVAFLTGVAASLGLGGGMILIIYLTVFAGLPQLSAQGINLVFFIPIAALSVFLHWRNKLIDMRKILPSILTGTAGAFLGTYLAQFIGSSALSKLFAGFILLVGIRELFARKKTTDAH